MKNFKKAFSFVELILVIVILGLVAAVFVPAMTKIRKDAREKAIETNVVVLIDAGKRYNIEKNTKSVDYKTLLDANYIKDIKSISGESYDKIKIDISGGKITVETPLGDVIEKEY